jgi:hypothetical protein
MKTLIQIGIKTLATTFLLAGLAVAKGVAPVLSTDDVVAKMLEHDAQREAQLGGYTATRHYLVAHKRSRAEMNVALTCAEDGVKEFKILSEEGSFAIRTLVFHRMLKEEAEASHPEIRNITRIRPSNYDFHLIGKEAVDGRPSYLLQVTPRHNNKYLIDGRVWVDADDYSIVRIEGRPARNPSFWTRSVHFVHTYQKVGPFWFAASTHSVSEIRIYGSAEVTIESSDYVTKSADRINDTNRQARLGQ